MSMQINEWNEWRCSGMFMQMNEDVKVYSYKWMKILRFVHVNELNEWRC